MAKTTTPTLTKDKVLAYLEKHPLTEQELLGMYVMSLPKDCEILTKKEDISLFERLSQVEGLSDYLAMTIHKDMQRYFSAGSPMEQIQIKGAASRTIYLKSKLGLKKEVVTKKAKKLFGTRYAG